MRLEDVFSSRTTTFIALLTLTFSTLITSQSTKSGLPYHTPIGADKNDYNIFFTTNSSISWYYNWSPYPSPIPRQHTLEFIPMIHGISNLESDISTITSLSPSPRHILTFNEPDGSTSSGGSNISPQDAAKAYLSSILPLRSAPHNYLISHPVTTGSTQGLTWLTAFNASCYSISPSTGCPADFVAAHYYGDFPGMASWLGTLHAFYPGKQIYLTEFALPAAAPDVTTQMLSTSLPFLDDTEWIGGYAWFGLFRPKEANGFTGDGPAMVDNQGGLTELGSLYLGGSNKGFGVGEKSGASGVGWFGGGSGGGSNNGGGGSGGGGGGGNGGGGMLSIGRRLCFGRSGVLIGFVSLCSWSLVW